DPGRQRRTRKAQNDRVSPACRLESSLALSFKNRLVFGADFAFLQRMPDWIAVVILGIIEGITEFIPVSSTGHLLLAEHALHLKESDLFNIVIQCGAVIAVLPLFSGRLKQFVFRWNEPAIRDYLLKILVAFFLTGAAGFVLDKAGLKLP